MNDGRVITAKLPEALVARMDEIAGRSDRSRSWIIRQALGEWLAEEQRRYELTLEAQKSVHEGRSFTQEEVEQWMAERKRQRGASAE
jgi:predicted transcriptional regulator